MVRKMKLKYVVVDENILDDFNVGHCGSKVKVTVALEQFNNLIFQITSRWLFIPESGKRYSKRHQLYIFYTVRYSVGRQSSIRSPRENQISCLILKT